MFSALSSLINSVLVTLGLKKEEPVSKPKQEPKEIPPTRGTHGPIEADGVIGEENGEFLLIIDYDFGDMPVWVQWDIDLKQISIAQNDGAVAILATILTEEQAQNFTSTDRLKICTIIGEERVVHTIPLMIRNSNDNNEDDLADFPGFGQELAIKD